MKYKRTIPFAGPWITKKEVAYTLDATIDGFYESRSRYIDRFESKMKEYVGMKYGLGLHCCTLALHTACASLGLQKGDEVICTDFSWVATADAIAYTGATPVFVDIEPHSWCISPDAIEQAITKKTKAIMIVDSFGYPCDMDRILAVAKKHKLPVIEDAAPALGSTYKGKKAGSFGAFGCFSFQGGKIAVSGEGGMLLTNDKKLYERAKFLTTMGRTDRKAVFWCDEIGYQYTISNLTAALAVAQVERISELVRKKRQIFKWYERGLKNIEQVALIKETKDIRCNYCWPSLMLSEKVKINRTTLLQKLVEHNIFGRPAFPRMSLMPMFEERFTNPVATKVSTYGINLPSALNLEEEDIDFVCRTITKLVV